MSAVTDTPAPSADTAIRTYGTYQYRPEQVAYGPRKSRGYWELTLEPGVATRVKRIFGRISVTRTGVLTIADSPEVARDLQWMQERWPLLPADDLSEKRLCDGADHHRATEQSVARILKADPRAGKLPMEPAKEPRDYQLVAVELLRATGRLLLTDQVGLGKAQPLDSNILTPSGYVKMADIAVGDLVIAKDGTPTKVTGVYPQGELDVYEVTFTDGATVRCNDEHLWTVRNSAGPAVSKKTGGKYPVYWRTATLRKLIDSGLFTKRVNSAGQAKWHVPMMDAPNLDSGGTRPLDAYFLGALLGDGCFSGTSPNVSISSADAELLASIEAVLPPGVVLKSYGTRPYDYRIVSVGGLRHAVTGRLIASNPVIAALKELEIWGHGALEKFIPPAYLNAPAPTRLAILQGLMDTDGHAAPLRLSATAQFYSSSKRLALDVQWLARSLGGIGRLTSSVKVGKERYTVTVKLPQPLNPFRLSRKAAVWGDGHSTLRPTRALKSAELVGKAEMQCISVEHPEHLYVTDDFVVTHNTFTGALGAVHEDALPMLVVPPTHLPGRWMEELKDSFPWLTTGVAQKTTLPKDWTPEKIPDVFIVPYSRLAGWAPHLHGHVKTVIFDEVQDLRKGVDTQKGKAAAHVSDGATFIQGLSATPLYNYGGEIWNIYDIIAPGELGTKDEFAREWGRPMQNGGIMVTDPPALGSYLREQALMLGRTREEVGRELPETIKVAHTINSDPAALNAVKGDAIAMAKLILADTSTRQERMQAAGELDWKLREATGIGKAPYVAEFCRMLLESEDKIILAGWHRQVYEIWNDLLADFKPAMYTGSESPAQKTASEKAFVEGDSRILVMSLRSGAGLDGLQKVCGVSVFGELDWSPQVHEQLIGRTRRDGMGAKPPVAYFLNSLDGSDPALMEAAGIKRMQAEPMLSKDGKVFATAMPDAGRGRLLAEQILGIKKAA